MVAFRGVERRGTPTDRRRLLQDYAARYVEASESAARIKVSSPNRRAGMGTRETMTAGGGRCRPRRGVRRAAVQWEIALEGFLPCQLLAFRKRGFVVELVDRSTLDLMLGPLLPRRPWIHLFECPELDAVRDEVCPLIESELQPDQLTILD